ncbi:hypothetical protein L873DRAFT_1697748 [Choiromyces venosus 120613-1]|uniref:CENP-V/GFA domain-containing protein n=1 Tax=Choiromyces venosus 120613-1 TaxID=1336337 RepID=A0A3N4JB54_9PEZI|nr:hypothetical protein L873DRAFT_1697748 [Choiromyces venosus 120613-1]
MTPKSFTGGCQCSLLRYRILLPPPPNPVSITHCTSPNHAKTFTRTTLHISPLQIQLVSLATPPPPPVAATQTLQIPRMPSAVYIPGARPRLTEEQPPGYEDSEAGRPGGGVGWPYREFEYAGGVRGFCAHCGGVVFVWGCSSSSGSGGDRRVEVEMGSLDAPGEVFGCFFGGGGVESVCACCS